MANDNFTPPGFDLSPWQNKDPLTLLEVACLWAGYPPGLHKARESVPGEFAVMRERAQQIKQAAEAGRIDYKRPDVDRKINQAIPRAVDEYGLVTLSGWRRGPTAIQTTERGPVAWESALFTRAALKGYADSIGERPAFLFPEAVEVSALRCLDKTDPHFSGELEAAILAWQYASERAEEPKKKIKALISEWLKANRPQYDDGGNAFDRIATLANWEKKTGPKALK